MIALATALFLSMSQGQAAILSVARYEDHPTVARVEHCRRHNARQIGCELVEEQISPGNEAEAEVITQLTGHATATLERIRGRTLIRVHIQ